MRPTLRQFDEYGSDLAISPQCEHCREDRERHALKEGRGVDYSSLEPQRPNRNSDAARTGIGGAVDTKVNGSSILNALAPESLYVRAALQAAVLAASGHTATPASEATDGIASPAAAAAAGAASRLRCGGGRRSILPSRRRRRANALRPGSRAARLLPHRDALVRSHRRHRIAAAPPLRVEPTTAESKRPRRPRREPASSCLVEWLGSCSQWPAAAADAPPESDSPPDGTRSGAQTASRCGTRVQAARGSAGCALPLFLPIPVSNPAQECSPPLETTRGSLIRLHGRLGEARQRPAPIRLVAVPPAPTQRIRSASRHWRREIVSW